MDAAPRIRVITLGLIQSGDRLFVSRNYDRVKQKTFYRALGGGVEFGESSQEALHREFREELQAALINLQYLGCLENRFVYNGQPGHELIQLYRCDFADRRFYHLEELTFEDSNQSFTALWVDRHQFHSGDLWLVPEACLDYL